MNESAPPPRILVVDDEPQIRRFLEISLRAQGYRIAEAATAQAGLEELALRGADLVVLDLGLPDRDGHEVLADLRSWSAVPVIVLSVRASEEEKVRALDAGANDYVTKPFGIQELMARVRNLLRTKGGDSEAPVFDDGHLRIDLPLRTVTLDGETVPLSRKEFGVVEMLLRYAGRVVTQPQLLRELSGTVACRGYAVPARRRRQDPPEARRRCRRAALPSHRARRRLPLHRRIAAARYLVARSVRKAHQGDTSAHDDGHLPQRSGRWAGENPAIGAEGCLVAETVVGRVLRMPDDPAARVGTPERACPHRRAGAHDLHRFVVAPDEDALAVRQLGERHFDDRIGRLVPAAGDQNAERRREREQTTPAQVVAQAPSGPGREGSGGGMITRSPSIRTSTARKGRGGGPAMLRPWAS